MLLLIGVLFTGPVGCDVQPGGSSTTAKTDGPRIVSLTPAITQMLIDMGKRDQIVGVSQEDDASLGLPVCGSYNKPVMAKIIKLEPDVVLTQSSTGLAGGVPSSLRSQADRGLYKLKIVSYSRSIADVERALTDAEDGLGVAIGDPQAAEYARDLMALRIELVRAVLDDAKSPRVLMLINPTTLGALGTGVTHDELLRLAGGTNALAHINTGYLTLDRAKLQQTIRPDVVLILEPNGVDLRDGDPRLRAMEGLTIPAVMNKRYAVIKHPQAMLPSTSLPEVMVEMAIALHPDRAADIREAYDTAEIVMKKMSRDKDSS
ncbi:MAG: ABC transporter substrate-binding protein [Phycisphaeraceae bacterium]